MPGSNHIEIQEIINQLCVYIKQHAPATAVDLLVQLAPLYFSPCPVEDLREHSLADLYSMLYVHWEEIKIRKPGETHIRIFNPTKARDGWESTHTIIIISNDDIPFLVDSIRMAINRYAYQIHFIIHFGGLKVKRDSQYQVTE